MLGDAFHMIIVLVLSVNGVKVEQVWACVIEWRTS